MFKIGDKVRIDPELWLKNRGYNLSKKNLDAIGTVTEVDHTENYPIFVVWEPKLPLAYTNWTAEGGFNRSTPAPVLVLADSGLSLNLIFSL